MTWFKVDDGLHKHRKRVRTGVTMEGFAAMGVWAVVGSWCADELTDGFVPDDVLAYLAPGVGDELAARLERAGFWHRTTRDGEEGWQFHDWEDYQPSKEEALATSKAKSLGGAVGNHRRWHVERGLNDPDCVYCSNLDRMTDRITDQVTDRGTESGPNRPSRPDPTRPEKEPTPPAPASPPADTNSNTVIPGWLADPKPSRPSKTTQSGLFGTTQVKLTERQQIIDDWLRLNGYPTDTAFTKAVEKAVRQAFPGKTVAYIRGVAGPNGSGFGQFADQVRKEHAEATEQAIRALEATEPVCEHGTPAGRSPHPTHGDLLCARCRRGLPATADESTTHPDVAAALAAYRAAHTGRPLSTLHLVAVTQQAEALRTAGVPGYQLADLARTAAATGVGLLAAATRKDHAA